jgi:hypothetical protein
MLHNTYIICLELLLLLLLLYILTVIFAAKSEAEEITDGLSPSVDHTYRSLRDID